MGRLGTAKNVTSAIPRRRRLGLAALKCRVIGTARRSIYIEQAHRRLCRQVCQSSGASGGLTLLDDVEQLLIHRGLPGHFDKPVVVQRLRQAFLFLPLKLGGYIDEVLPDHGLHVLALLRQEAIVLRDLLV